MGRIEGRRREHLLLYISKRIESASNTILNTLWDKYKSIVYTNCTVDGIARNSVDYWKNRLFAASVLFLIPMSFVAVAPGIYMAYKTNLIGLLITDSIAIGTILGVAFLPGFSVFARKLLFNGVLYCTSAVLLHYLGSHGPGLLYLFGITVFVLLSLDQKYGFVAFGLNVLICIYFGFAIYYEFASTVIQSEYQLDAWIGVSSNLVFLSGTAVFLIPLLFKGLQSAFEEQDRLRGKLEQSVEDLNAKNEELEQFAYTVSHDLKEPLRMVRSFLKLLKDKYRDQLDEKAHEYIHFAVDGATRMGKNINDLLEYSRIGRKYTAVENVNLNELVEEVQQNLMTDIQKSNARISVSDLPTLPVVPVALKILFQNLISNALKYQADENQPVVNITAESKDEHWLFSVSDNGIGIEPEYHDQIFVVFERLHPGEEYPGNGMGLAIGKKIVEQHGGSIWVKSEEGNGSTFCFTLGKQYFVEDIG